MPAAPQWVTTDWRTAEFDAGDGLPAITRSGTLITDQPTLDGLVASAAAQEPPVILVFGDTDPTPSGTTTPIVSQPFIRYDRVQSLNGTQQGHARSSLGLGTMATQDSDNYAAVSEPVALTKVPKPVSGDPLGTSAVKTGTGAVAYLINRPRSVTEFATSGFTVLGGAELNTAIAAVADHTTLVIPDRVTVDVGSTPILYQHPVTVMSDWRGTIQHSGHPSSGGAHRVTSSGVAFRGVKLQGPSAGTYVAGEHAIAANGTDNGADVAPTMLTDLDIIDCDIVGFGSVAIQPNFVDGLKVRGTTLRQCGYGGVQGLSVLHAELQNLRIRDILPGTSGNQYAVQATRQESTDLVRYPRSAYWDVIGGEVSDVPNWDGVGCHGGMFIVVDGMVFDGVLKPVEFVGCQDGAGRVAFAPLFCRASNIVADSGTRAGTNQTGFIIAGGGGAGVIGSPDEYALGCAFEGITAIGFGDPTKAIGCAIYLHTTRATRIRGIQGIECSSNVVLAYYDNPDLDIDGVTGVDTWSSGSTIAAVVNCNSQNNTGMIDHITVSPGTRTPAGGQVQNTHGIYMASNDAGTSMLQGPTTRLGAATVAAVGGGGLSKLSVATSPPTDVQVFTAASTWTKAAGAKTVHVRAWGGGGGGGSGAREATGTLATGGAGGGSGGFTDRWYRAADLAATVSCTIGAAGTGGAAVTADSTVGNAGIAGGFSLFGTAIGTYFGYATAGANGAGGTAAGAATGGAAGVGGTSAGAAGAASSATGLVGATSASSQTGAPTGGGAGGGITTGNASSGGGNAGSVGGANGGVGGAADNAGVTGTTFPAAEGGPGCGGGGGGSSVTTAGGAGGNGGSFGAGGGGGGASRNGNNSGKGGDGAPGLIIVETYF